LLTDICRVYELQEPAADTYSASTAPGLESRLDRLASKVTSVLQEAGFPSERIKLERILNMRFDGSDTALMIPSTSAGGDYDAEFKKAYKKEFGFLLNKDIIVDDVKVRGIGRTFDAIGESAFKEAKQLKLQTVDTEKADFRQRVYVWDKPRGEGRWVDTPVFELGNLEKGDRIAGPALVIDDTQTVFVNA
jgi:5-oxoprolinase (ATP-hydrolysing)